jgi:hypothetical protein
VGAQYLERYDLRRSGSVAEMFFSIPATVTPMVQGNVVAEPIVDSPVPIAATPIIDSLIAETDEEEKPFANHEEEQQEPSIQDVPHNEPPRRF